MSLRLDPRGLRSIEQVVADLNKTAAQLSPTNPRAAKIAKMIQDLRRIEGENMARSGSPPAKPMR
jgi:hypothetical protein